MGYVIFMAVVAAIGGILFGYDTAVISGTTEIVRNQFALNDLVRRLRTHRFYRRSTCCGFAERLHRKKKDNAYCCYSFLRMRYRMCSMWQF